MGTGNSIADVAIIGAGPAGMAAASSAVRSGASVIVLESGDRIGGNAVRSNGYLAFVAATPDAREAFIADARAAHLAVADRYGVVWDETAVRQFAARSAETYRDLVRRGVRFSRTVPRPGHSVDRIHAMADPAMLGRAYAQDFATVETHVGVRAERLIAENGRIAGVVAHRLDTGAPLTVRANRAVILATGGYQAGHLLRARYQSFDAAGSAYYGTSACRGDGHLMGSTVGGELVNMAYLPPTVLAASPVVENAIAINTSGVRFHDETASFDDRVDALRRQDHRAWYVLDATAAQGVASVIEQMPQPPVRADGVTELAAALHIPAGSLAATIDEWNAFLGSAAGTDPRFGRTALPAGRRGLGGPLIAVPMVEGVSISCGGFRTDPRMQVLDGTGSAIPGLYAAGDTTAGLNAAAGMPGLHICGALTQGRIAGRAGAVAPAGRTRLLVSA